MEDLVSSGHIVDWILVFVGVEAVVLVAYRRMTGRGLKPRGILFMLLPGVCLLLAVHAALIAAGPVIVAGWLAAALVAHLADLWQRQRQSRMASAVTIT
jgi:hypothetical protein